MANLLLLLKKDYILISAILIIKSLLLNHIFLLPKNCIGNRKDKIDSAFLSREKEIFDKILSF